MKILSIDTATKVASAAVISDEELLGQFTLNLNKPHSQKIMPLVDSLLKGLDLCLGEMDAFAVNLGPGSFTGLRIGIAAVKGLGFSLNKPVIGICSLDALAFDLPFCEFLICPLIDARRGQVYCGLYVTKQQLDTIMEPCVMHVSALCDSLKKRGGKIVFIGDAIYSENREIIANTLKENALFSPSHHGICSAASIGALAKIKLESGYKKNSLLPLYLLKSYVDQTQHKQKT